MIRMPVLMAEALIQSPSSADLPDDGQFCDSCPDGHGIV